MAKYRGSKGSVRKARKRATERAQDFIRAYKESVGCARCGERYAPCLHLHHREPDTKKHRDDSAGRVKTLAKARLQISICDVLCANCHIKLHRGFFEEKVRPVIRVVDPRQVDAFAGLQEVSRAAPG